MHYYMFKYRFIHFSSNPNGRIKVCIIKKH
nr:MAG TPA: hypothetical protein [Bacteriophage sp.]